MACEACLRYVLKRTPRIEGGTSGGPIIEESGRLIGIVSNSFEGPDHGKYSCMIPVSWLALPRWISNVIAKTSREA
jgi:S1-C subfamily serine protease